MSPFAVPCLTAAQSPVLAVRSAPAFTLPDAAGHRRSLEEFRGRPIAVLFFCGCTPCRDFARLWAQAQQNGDFRDGEHASAVVVFGGDRAAANAFAEQTKLDLFRTLVLADPDDSISRKFDVGQCPRVFVLDTAGKVTYSSPEAGKSASRLPPLVLFSRVLTVWRGVKSIHGTPGKVSP